MPNDGRGFWPVATILLFLTTVLFGFLTLYYRGQVSTLEGGGEGKAAEEPAQKPPERTRSAWETESVAAPLANVPVYEVRAGVKDPVEIELKTTVQWFVVQYALPEDMTLKTPELMIYGPGDRVSWGAGPLPTADPGEKRAVAIPGEFLSRGLHKIQLRGAGGNELVYQFQITRRRHAGEMVAPGE
ncbi:MAG: hypothetical protein GF355_12365 [Candidatus Eisenbacteria bacterium]|nr:hypothetical protein [Candidatus Eisenbacteria bacterium]